MCPLSTELVLSTVDLFHEQAVLVAGRPFAWRGPFRINPLLPDGKAGLPPSPHAVPVPGLRPGG